MLIANWHNVRAQGKHKIPTDCHGAIAQKFHKVKWNLLDILWLLDDNSCFHTTHALIPLVISTGEGCIQDISHISWIWSHLRLQQYITTSPSHVLSTSEVFCYITNPHIILHWSPKNIPILHQIVRFQQQKFLCRKYVMYLQETNIIIFSVTSDNKLTYITLALLKSIP